MKLNKVFLLLTKVKPSWIFKPSTFGFVLVLLFLLFLLIKNCNGDFDKQINTNLSNQAEGLFTSPLTYDTIYLYVTDTVFITKPVIKYKEVEVTKIKEYIKYVTKLDSFLVMVNDSTFLHDTVFVKVPVNTYSDTINKKDYVFSYNISTLGVLDNFNYSIKTSKVCPKPIDWVFGAGMSYRNGEVRPSVNLGYYRTSQRFGHTGIQLGLHHAPNSTFTFTFQKGF